MAATARYTREVGRKFYADGTPRIFAGNTIICMVDPASPIGQAAAAFQQSIGGLPFGAKFAMLPPSSFHMTVMELLCDETRLPERWSPQLDLAAPLAETDAFFLARVPAVPAPDRLVMRAEGVAHRQGLMVMLQPADDAVATAIWGYRAAIAAATGVRFPDHDAYRFHISLAYRLVELEPAEEQALADHCASWAARLCAAGAAISLPAPALTFFDDMFRFVPAAERHTLRTR